MTETQKIAWKRLSVEAAAIVASILLAFAIDAWWEDRQLGIEETEILLGLKQEFQLNLDVLVQSVEFNSDMLLATEELMNACRRDSWESEKFRIDQALFYLMAPPTLHFGGGVLSALISAGRLETVSNYDLRVKLAGWSVIFDEVRDDEIWNSRFVEDRVVPYYLRWHVPISSGAYTLYGDWPLPSRSIADDPDDLARLLSDPEFEILLELRYHSLYHTAGEYETALQAIKDILDELDDSL